MKKLLGIALLLAIVATGINDLGRWATASYDLGITTDGIAQHAADIERRTRGSRESVGIAAAVYGSQQGVTVTTYDQDDTRVYVTTQAKVTGTWLLAPVSALLRSKPASEGLSVRAKAMASSE